MAQKNKYTWAKATRDITVTAINKGQLPILGVTAIFLVVLLRIPEEYLVTLLKDLISHLVVGELFSYILLAVTLGSWFTHSKILRSNATKETNRISAEKTRLQNELAKKNFKSSD